MNWYEQNEMERNSFPYNLINDIVEKSRMKDFLSIEKKPNDMWGSVYYVLHSLDERQRKILELRYEQSLTLKQIGEEFDVTKECIRQNIEKSLRCLAHPQRMDILLKGVKTYYEETQEEKRAIAERQGFMSARDLYSKKIREIMEIDADSLRSNDKNVPSPLDAIETLGLSVRSYNILKRAGVNTVKDIIDLGAVNVSRLRNLGKHSYEEISDILVYKYGCRWADWELATALNGGISKI